MKNRKLCLVKIFNCSFSTYCAIISHIMENKSKFRPNPKLKLMDQVREVLRYHHYAYRTEQTYTQWILRYVRFFGAKTHPRDLDARDIERFLSDLTLTQKVSASTQRQALNALVFLYRDVLDLPLDGKIQPVRSKKKFNLPTVLGREEIIRLFRHINGTHALMAKILYGSGLRLMECVRLRIKDFDFDRKRIHVLGKGNKWRSTILADPILSELQTHIKNVKALHQCDLEQGFGEVYIPEALGRKYKKAAMETQWQYVFPSKKRSIDPRSGQERRHHVMESGLQKAVKRASGMAGIDKRVTCHTLRHSFATTMLENGINIRVLQEIMGHADVKTTERYTHVMDKDISRISSPLEGLDL
ncbi:integron integrase [Desulfobacula phenolica]|uniref:Integron integrase n=1 Tax=Desulfobacula phenolica TaxID=90732 RepID=A0A1H2K1S8_9BACT|nr:integron integrase [Desulfobacula phenolica]SDU62664.1 integron integrase [Desulfobacula phenolica]